jgi:2-polyprenyl-3-methyl-5-hydroxy-6-metoxy-1,4-benzoquinol methylase
MDIYSQIERKLGEKGITINIPVKEFIDNTSNIFHRYEARKYDATQSALLDSVEYWEEAFSFLNDRFEKDDSLTVLDFGCGTGFATKLLLKSSLKEKCKTIYCYDLSPDMIETFRGSLADSHAGTELIFITDADEFGRLVRQVEFDIVLTNSILHHIPVPEEIVSFLIRALNTNGYYISGHEPNRSFYFNRATTGITAIFRIFKKVYYRVSAFHLKRTPGAKKAVNTIEETNSDLIRNGMINKPIPGELMVKLIDIHVPVGNSTDQCWGEIGFDKTLYENASGKNSIELVRYFTYSHIKDPLCNRFFLWRKLKQLLAVKYPHDGGDFLAIIKKIS